MNIQLLGCRVLLAPVKKEIKIIDPNDADLYEVIEVGSEVKEIKKGEKVIYENGRKIKLFEEEYIIVNEEDITLKVYE